MQSAYRACHSGDCTSSYSQRSSASTSRSARSLSHSAWLVWGIWHKRPPDPAESSWAEVWNMWHCIRLVRSLLGCPFALSASEQYHLRRDQAQVRRASGFRAGTPDLHPLHGSCGWYPLASRPAVPPLCWRDAAAVCISPSLFGLFSLWQRPSS